MDYCVCCGEYVPEGRMVCASCWKRYMEGDDCPVSEGVGERVVSLTEGKKRIKMKGRKKQK